MSERLPETDLTAATISVPLEGLRNLLIALLTKFSVFEYDAKVAVERMLDADLRGIPQHGAMKVLELIQAMDAGDIDPRGRMLTVVDKPAFAVLDGSRALGMVAATRGMELAIKKARECGTGTVAVGNSQTLGAASAYALLATREGMLGCCITSTGGATVTAPGTHQGATGNHGIAWAVPAGDTPLVIDLSNGSTSWGKVQLLKELGLPLPQGIAVTSSGDVATAPQDAAKLLQGGGALGFGLGLMASVLAGPLAGGKMPIHKRRATVSSNDSEHFCYVIDIAQFTDVDRFRQEVSTALQDIRQLPPVDSAVPVRVPGDRGHARTQELLASGSVPLLKSAANQIASLAARKKLEVPW